MVPIADFVFMINPNYNYPIFLALLIFAVILMFKLIQFLFFKKPLKLKTGENTKKDNIVINEKAIEQINDNKLKNKGYLQQPKQTKEEKNVQALQKWRAQNEKEKEQNKSNAVSEYTLKIKSKEERRLKKTEQKEAKIILRKLEKERLDKEIAVDDKINNLENIKGVTQEKSGEKVQKLSWFEQQEEKLRLRKLESENYSKNLDSLKLSIKNRTHEINKLKKIEEKRAEEKNDQEKLNKKAVKRSAQKINKITKPVTLVSKTPFKSVVQSKPIKQKEKTAPNTTKRVNYSTDNIITSTTQYPVIRKPKQDSIIRSFRLGRNNRKGYKEEEFYNAIKEHFYKDFDIIDNAMLAIGEGTNPYEPDIAMISKGIKNIYIDIEIDEPYAGVSRKLTHCYPDDSNRDNYFTDRGWLVIRFSEYQVHHQINYCLYQIVKVISLIDYNCKIGFLAPYRSIEKEKCWDYIQAQNWEILNYREKYLQHNFKPYEESKKIIQTSLTKEEQLEENLVKSTSSVVIKKPSIPIIPTYAVRPKVYVAPTREVVKPTPVAKKEFNSNNSTNSDLIEMAILKGYAIEMNYTNKKGEKSVRKISKLESTLKYTEFGYGRTEHFIAFCHNNLEERSFRVSRINYMKILN